ncbi:MAG: (Fe-S)-binding protein [Acidimicrobiales bacterium]|nr:(Fe-S)-binding protein [Acidimicrobiales bacterium]
MSGPLGLDDDALATCVACGLCLPHCPTFRVTGDEAASPRGRIAAMRLVQWQGAAVDADFTAAMDTCVQCRGCEPVCPSAVPFGALMEGTRAALAADTPYQPWWRRLGYRLLGHHSLLLAGSSLLAVAQRLRLLPVAPAPGADPGAGSGLSGRLPVLPRLTVRREPLEATGDDVWLFTGCVMDAWQRPVHAATMRVLGAAGAGVRPTGGAAGCCGALATHAGLTDVARGQAEQVMAAVPGDAPILVNSAGCGAQLKDYGHLLGTPEAAAFSARVLDVHEWLAGRLDTLPAPGPSAAADRVAVQDPCHLRHVQKQHQAVRDVLAPYVTLVELDDEGLCCGAGGAYSATQPELSSAIRDRKLGAITRAGAPVVASANPGCALHLAAAGVDARHPMEILDALLPNALPDARPKEGSDGR